MSDNKALKLADAYADAASTHRLESLYGTSKSYTLEKAKERDEAHSLLEAELRRLAAVEKELERIRALPVARWEYRWTNPGDNPNPTESEKAWHEIQPRNSLETLDERKAVLLAYRYNGKPCYEVRALFALTKDPT